jgi:hypothetical protein
MPCHPISTQTSPESHPYFGMIPHLQHGDTADTFCEPNFKPYSNAILIRNKPALYNDQIHQSTPRKPNFPQPRPQGFGGRRKAAWS